MNTKPKYHAHKVEIRKSGAQIAHEVFMYQSFRSDNDAIEAAVSVGATRVMRHDMNGCRTIYRAEW
jgi:hypothetical protein